MNKKSIEEVVDGWTDKFVTRRLEMLNSYMVNEFSPEDLERHKDNLFNIQIRDGEVALLKMMMLAEGYSLSEPVTPTESQELSLEDIQWLVEYGRTKDRRIVLPEVPGEANSTLDWVMLAMLNYLDQTHYDRARVEKTLWTRIKLISQLNLG